MFNGSMSGFHPERTGSNPVRRSKFKDAMANSYNTNPIVLDSVMAQTAKQSGLNVTGQLKVKLIHWDNAKSTQTDTATLVDENGNMIWSETAASSGPFPLIPPQVINDFKLTVLQEGKVYIYL